MLKNIKNFKARNQSGFTIIEVMIVLAVAALIILIVLLAVPALQRSSRNTTIKNDAASVASAVTQFEDNNNGILPDTTTTTNGKVSISNKTSGTPTSGTVQGSTAVCTIPGSTTVPIPSATNGCTSDTGNGTNIAPGEVQVMFGYSCPSSPISSTSKATKNLRGTAIFYATENGGGNYSLQCIDT